MTDTILELIAEYGVWLVGLTTFFSCLAMPVPASLMMIAGGAFAASGDLSITSTAIAAYIGAVAGDQTGFAIGRRGEGLLARMQNNPGKRGQMLKRADAFADKWGRLGAFLSRWLFSPLGPYVNFISGATGLGWLTFTISAAAGEVIWVVLYTGLGYTFSNHIEMVADLASNISGLLAAALVAVLLGRYLFRAASPGAPDF
jgi:membrane protein DedA with SNARE-associated domain